MDSVCNVSDRHFVLRPARKERRKDAPAYLPVQTAHPIDRPAPSHSQVGQTLKTEADDFQKRVKSGELEAKVRSEVLAALRMANDQLKKAFSGGASSETRTAEPPAKPEEK